MNTADIKQLTQYAAISAAVGAGGAGIYGLIKSIHDNSALAKNRLKKYETRVGTPGSKKPKPPEAASEAALELESTPTTEDELIPAEKTASPPPTWTQENLINPLQAGAVTPIAMLAPGVVAYLIGKSLIDKNRKSKFKGEVNKAREEFEAVLGKTSSDLQVAVDQLYLSKEAGLGSALSTVGDYLVPDNIADFFAGGRNRSGISAPLEQPASELGWSPRGVAFGAGLPIGIGGLLGWTLMNSKMKSLPEKRKLKELQTLLKREIAADSLSAGIDLSEGEDGKAKYNL